MWLNRLPFLLKRLPMRVHGQRMCAHTLDRYLALWLWKWGRLEAAGIRCLDDYCRPGMRVVDIGANIGVYTLALAGRVGPKGRVWAFEPDPGNAESLRRNVEMNGYCNVEIARKAVGASTEQGSLYLDEAHHGDHRVFSSGHSRRQIPIDVVALDDCFETGAPPDFIKIDVQGAEQLVLSGMSRILGSRNHLVLFLELSVGDPIASGCSVEGIVGILEHLGYTFAWIDEDSLQVSPTVTGSALLERVKSELYVNIVATGPGGERMITQDHSIRTMGQRE